MNIGQWPTKWAALLPDESCIKYEDLTLSNVEFNRRINRLSHALQASGIRRGDRVAVLMANSNVFLEIFLSVSKLGAIMVPLNFRLAAPELEFIIGNSEPSILFYSPEFLPLVEELAGAIPSVKQLVCETSNAVPGHLEYESWIAQEPETEPVPNGPVTLADPHIIMYTSGTTGTPKGAVITQGNTQWSAVNYIHDYPITHEDIRACCAPLFHIGALCTSATPSLYMGATLVIQRFFDAAGILRLIGTHKVNSMLGIVVMFQFMSQQPTFAKTDFSSVKYFVTGGSPCPKSLIETYQKKGVTFAQGYGLTEASIVSSLSPRDSLRKRGSCGKPMFHVSLKVVDVTGEEVPAGVSGEIVVKGPVVIPEYWRRPEATRESIVDGWLHTGDIGYLDDEGYLYIKDRKKDMYISGGENVYPAEVEDVIMGIPEVADVGVIGIPDEKWGETGLAVVVKAPDATITEARILDICADRLAKYKIPRQVVFTDQLPRTTSGKTLKTQLRTMFKN